MIDLNFKVVLVIPAFKAKRVNTLKIHFQFLLQAESGLQVLQMGFNHLPSYCLLFSDDADADSGQRQVWVPPRKF